MPAPLYTDQTLIETALRKLGALDFGQSVPAEQMQVLQDKIAGMLDDLSQREIYPAGTTAEIVPAAWDYVADVLAFRVRNEFGLSGEALARVTLAKQEAEQALRAITSVAPPLTPAIGSYF